MLHKKYIQTYLGTFQRETGMQTAECVWNAKLYAKEVQNITLGSFGGSALSGWQGRPYQKWKRTINTPLAVPKQGDHIFWGTGMGQYGHVAIIDVANINYFTCIEQNRTGKPGDAPGDEIRVSTYDYKNVLGWFTPIKNLHTYQ